MSVVRVGRLGFDCGSGFDVVAEGLGGRGLLLYEEEAKKEEA